MGIAESRDARHNLLHRLFERHDDVVAALEQQSTLQTPGRAHEHLFHVISHVVSFRDAA
jgi:hypothetical protein